MLKVYCIEPIHKASAYASFKQPEQRVITRNQTKACLGDLSFQQHLEFEKYKFNK